ncbi:Uma2 family endonuclease [Bradyrhizobium vignae]|uniref:Uma2 family endonuclease n=1 Tax=Bradyrhizobium vignae TaxID=1549949 RepID=A0ABS3ZYN2_9BRAD|nr:Uma2 family endonuclease [Bradyrhizobium vignae]MBP0112813.1 Uma2 family endonuclease [Bradyrhizobium vignae]
MHKIEISDATYETATRIAALDDIDVQTLIESLVLRHSEYIDILQKASSEKRRFGLEQHGESEGVDEAIGAPGNEKLTIDEFLKTVAQAEGRYELVGGAVQPVARGRQRDNIIRSNVLAAFVVSGKPRGCRATSINTAVQTGPDTIRYPDVVVDCGPRDAAAMTASKPTIVVEVSSPSNDAVDFGARLRDYQAVESIDTVLLIDSEIALTKVYRRQQDGAWSEESIEEFDVPVPLPSLATSITLNEIYDTLHM